MSRGGYNKDKVLIISLIFIISCSNLSKPNYTIVSTQPKETSSQIQIQPISKRFTLSKTQNYEIETKFLEILDESYNETYNRFNLNFNYSIIPQGIVYSYSEVEIKCIPDTKISQSQIFIDNCNYFFSLIEGKLSKILGVKK